MRKLQALLTYREDTSTYLWVTSVFPTHFLAECTWLPPICPSLSFPATVTFPWSEPTSQPSFGRLMSVIIYVKSFSAISLPQLDTIPDFLHNRGWGDNHFWSQGPWGLSWYYVCLEITLLLLTFYIYLRWIWEGRWRIPRDLRPQQFFPKCENILTKKPSVSEFLESYLNHLIQEM